MADRAPGFLQRTVIAVGAGSISRLPDECVRLGLKRPAVLIDQPLLKTGSGARIKQLVAHAVVIPRTPGEPTFSSVAKTADDILAADVDGVIAVGGGSTIDSGKIARGLLAADVRSPLEIPDQLPAEPLPLITVPTTAGTGAEIGSGAIVYDPDADDKVLVRRQEFAAAVAIADGDLTLSLPPQLTAYTGCDALAQAILAYVPAGWDSISGQTALRAIGLIYRNLPVAVASGADRATRANMMLGSVLSALAMYNAPPTYAGEHVFAEPIGPALGVHHGHAVAAFLAGTAEFNVEVLAPQYAEIAREIGIADQATSNGDASQGLVAALRQLVVELGIPALSTVVDEYPIEALVERCSRHESYAFNPRQIRPEDAAVILVGAYNGTFAAEYDTDVRDPAGGVT